MLYKQFTVGYYNLKDKTEYQIRVYAEDEAQAVAIVKRKFEKYGPGEFYSLEGII